jgi:hypothetical protein
MRLMLNCVLVGTMLWCPPVSAKRPDRLSWGKAGVPLADFARDAAECSETSRYVTAYIGPERLKQLDALSAAQLLDTVIQIGSSDAMNIVDAVTKLRSADDIARRTNTFGAKYTAMVSLDVKDQLQAVIDKCLVERGYVPIQLTSDQARGLHKFKQHSPERTAYLHAIDSDAAVIAGQSVALDGSEG